MLRCNPLKRRLLKPRNQTTTDPPVPIPDSLNEHEAEQAYDKTARHQTLDRSISFREVAHLDNLLPSCRGAVVVVPSTLHLRATRIGSPTSRPRHYATVSSSNCPATPLIARRRGIGYVLVTERAGL